MPTFPSFRSRFSLLSFRFSRVTSARAVLLSDAGLIASHLSPILLLVFLLKNLISFLYRPACWMLYGSAALLFPLGCEAV